MSENEDSAQPKFRYVSREVTIAENILMYVKRCIELGHDVDQDVIQTLIDRHAHRLAEKQRAEAQRLRAKAMDNPHQYIDPEDEATLDGMEQAADLIDPEVET